METFHGVFTPLVTPINDDETPDLESMRGLVEFQIESGVHGLWALGTSGEFAAFDERERTAALETVIEAAHGRVPVIANISDAGSRLAIRHARSAARAGASAIAATPSYYYPHSQDELLTHYRLLREAVDLPLFIYNIPQTVRVRVELSTAKTLAAEGTVAGIKDSQNDLEWFRELAMFAKAETPSFTLFAGTRSLIDAAVVAGADGVIPSIANAFPRLALLAYEAARTGDFNRSAQLEGVIIRIESLVSFAGAGSRNAAILGLQKAVLHRFGTIASAALTSPLRDLLPEEQERMWQQDEIWRLLEEQLALAVA